MAEFLNLLGGLELALLRLMAAIRLQLSLGLLVLVAVWRRFDYG